MILCKYGCGQEATTLFKKGGGCCSRRAHLCPAQILKTKIQQHTPDPITGLTPLQKRELTLNKIDPLTGLSKRQVRTKKMAKSQVTGGEDGLTPRQRAEAKLSQIDPKTGLTYKQLAGKKAQQTLSEVDPSTGLTGLQTKTKKTRESWENKTVEELASIQAKRMTTMSQTLETGLTRYQKMGLKISKTKTTIDPESGCSIAQLVAIRNKQNPIWHQKTTRGRASKESLLIFDAVIKQVSHLPITYIYGHANGCEWWLRTKDGAIKYYDFTIPEIKLIVEYHGDRYHPNVNKLSPEELNKWRTPYTHKSAQEVIDNDQVKLSTAVEQGYELIVVWSTDVREQIIERIVNRICQLCAKRGIRRASQS